MQDIKQKELQPLTKANQIQRSLVNKATPMFMNIKIKQKLFRNFYLFLLSYRKMEEIVI